MILGFYTCLIFVTLSSREFYRLLFVALMIYVSVLHIDYNWSFPFSGKEADGHWMSTLAGRAMHSVLGDFSSLK